MAGGLAGGWGGCGRVGDGGAVLNSVMAWTFMRPVAWPTTGMAASVWGTVGAVLNKCDRVNFHVAGGLAGDWGGRGRVGDRGPVLNSATA